MRRSNQGIVKELLFALIFLHPLLDCKILESLLGDGGQLECMDIGKDALDIIVEAV
jgi:hypothetical protein